MSAKRLICVFISSSKAAYKIVDHKLVFSNARVSMVTMMAEKNHLLFAVYM